MKKFKSLIFTSFIIFINFILFVSIFFVIDYLAWLKIGHDGADKIVRENYPPQIKRVYSPFLRTIKNEDTIDRYNTLRRPTLYAENKNNPILFLGCSYTYGVGVNENQTMPYQVYKNLHKSRTIYNFAIPGVGPSYNLFQLYSNKELMKIKDVDYIFYLIISDHRRRNYIYQLDPINTTNDDENRPNPRYRISNSELTYINPFRVFYSFYSVKFLQNYLEHKNAENIDKANNLELEILKKMEKRTKELWPNSKFIIIIADENPFQDLDFVRNNFNYIEIETEIGYKIGENNRTPCKHPNARIWRDFAPKLVQKYFNK